jgi:Zn-dependent peptidase ImmA (M78 family)
LRATSNGEPPGYDPQNEREANNFAAELLMPEERLVHEAAEHSLARLAKRYEVSQEAMSFRLLNLGLRQPEPATLR